MRTEPQNQRGDDKERCMKKFPVKVSIFYALDDECAIHKATYDFEASTYEFKNISPLH